ncbi:sugar transferase, partial [Listeria grandensis]|uniref:sugar transferase n=1 Tax=Listeria grandensis TaxID=1494963 RepID=UPI00164CFBDD
MYNRFLKRWMDIVLAVIGIILLAPVLALVAIGIKVDSKGPILFKQQRVGADKTAFTIFKFRTMYVDTPKDMPTHLLSSPDAYITKVGQFLRKTSLDELPQLFNILAGSMSV